MHEYQEDDFVRVSSRKALRKLLRKGKLPGSSDTDLSEAEIDCDSLLRGLLELETELKSSRFGEALFAQLKDSLKALNADGIAEILCYGLGRFSQCKAPKHQLALLMHLKEYYGAQAYLYDPSFSRQERELLEKLGFQVIDTNEEGKRTVNDKVTLAFLPHCPHYLTNNFLYANWSRDLCNCILIANSITSVVANTNFGKKSDSFMSRIEPFVTESALIRNTKDSDIDYAIAFHSTSLHIFPEHIINGLPTAFWAAREEPVYSSNDELVTAEKTKGLPLNEKRLTVTLDISMLVNNAKGSKKG